jgi:hypothetical protein
MANNFTSLGIYVNSPQEMIDFLVKASKYSERIDCEYGCLVKWESKTGAELWQHLTKEGKIGGFSLFYNGESNLPVRITKKIEKETYTNFEALLYAWTNTVEDDPSWCDFSFAFDCVNFPIDGKIEFPCIQNIKLSAFARELVIYVSEADYYAQQKGEQCFASKSFAPSGALPPDLDTSKQYEIFPEAIFTGIILDYKEYKNELTEKNFYWIKTETLGGIVIDVVADIHLVNNTLNINGVISGVFYLCGKIEIPLE